MQTLNATVISRVHNAKKLAHSHSCLRQAVTAPAHLPAHALPHCGDPRRDTLRMYYRTIRTLVHCAKFPVSIYVIYAIVTSSYSNIYYGAYFETTLLWVAIEMVKL